MAIIKRVARVLRVMAVDSKWAHLESTAMTRSTRATLLMIAMLWQSLVWLTPLGQAQLSTDITNAWVHAQAASIHAEHHHDLLNHQSDPLLHLNDHNVDGAHHHHEAAQPLGLASPSGCAASWWWCAPSTLWSFRCNNGSL